MYSSCPNIIRHFVPIKFSESALDYKTGPPLIPIKDNPVDIPFTNMKLQCLKSKPKDFVLIFKNESNREYSPKKKIRYTSLMKEMRERAGVVEYNEINKERHDQRGFVQSNAPYQSLRG